MDVFEIIGPVIDSSDFNRAVELYKELVPKLATGKTVLEIGAGRNPLLTPTVIAENNIDYYANDVNAAELAIGSSGGNHAVFDISGDVPPEFVGKFDFVYSRMVLEHVPDGRRYYENVRDLLAENGYAVTYNPTLFSPPFVMNWLLPESLSSRILHRFFPNRGDSGMPKFPATYQWCHATHAHARKIQSLGFNHVEIIPFYHHYYFEGIPVLKQLDWAFNRACQSLDIRLFASYAFTIAAK